MPTPTLLSRADWGADESWRERPPRYNKTIQQAHVHHTASGNDYAEADVPAIIRGFYRYHTGTLGWSDIGYNFLVDKFGRTWVGRAGGPGRPVRGAHTLGFNATSVGTSVIGNFDLVAPGRKVLESLAAVAAWKLHPYGRDPEGTTRVDSEGSDKFRVGRVVALPVIDGHRDTNDTACPGQHLYDHLPGIRKRAQAIITLATTTPTVEITTPSILTGSPIVGQTLTVTPGTFTPTGTASSYSWLRNQVAIPGATARTYLVDAADLGTLLAVQVTTRTHGHKPAVETLPVSTEVEAATTTSAQSRPRIRKAVIHVRVSAAGTEVLPTGSVTVTLRHQQQTVPLNEGAAIARFTNLAPGHIQATVNYPGGDHFSASETLLVVEVEPRG